MAKQLLLYSLGAASISVIGLYFVINSRLQNYRYRRIAVDTLARWNSLELTRKIRVLQTLQEAPFIQGTSEAELDRIFLQFLANTCQQMRQQGSFDMSWLRLE